MRVSYEKPEDAGCTPHSAGSDCHGSAQCRAAPSRRLFGEGGRHQSPGFFGGAFAGV